MEIELAPNRKTLRLRAGCVPTLRRCPSRGSIQCNNPSDLQRGRDRDEDDDDTNAVMTVIYLLLLSLVRLDVVLFSALSSILRSQIPGWSLWVRGLSDRTKERSRSSLFVPRQLLVFAVRSNKGGATAVTRYYYSRGGNKHGTADRRCCRHQRPRYDCYSKRIMSPGGGRARYSPP